MTEKEYNEQSNVRDLHKIHLISKGIETHVFIDDKEFHGCISANFEYKVNSLPVVKLEFYATDIDVDGEKIIINPGLYEKRIMSCFKNNAGRRYGKYSDDITFDELKQFYDDIESGEIYVRNIGQKKMRIMKLILERNGYHFNNLK